MAIFSRRGNCLLNCLLYEWCIDGHDVGFTMDVLRDEFYMATYGDRCDVPPNLNQSVLHRVFFIFKGPLISIDFTRGLFPSFRFMGVSYIAFPEWPPTQISACLYICVACPNFRTFGNVEIRAGGHTRYSRKSRHHD